MLTENLAEVLDGACPIVASFGDRDNALAGAADKPAVAGVTADVTEYPQARLGFINRITCASPLTRIAGVGYDHDAAADAKRRNLAFFDNHLQGTAARPDLPLSW
jgi:carboxymethylenebutenolidase